MYFEAKGDGVDGPARIGRMRFSKSGQSVYYRGRRYETLAGAGFKANYFDVETGEPVWISGCKKRGGDRLYSGTIEIDADVRAEYWTAIRGEPARRDEATIRCRGEHGR
jgi:hypothetical protein